MQTRSAVLAAVYSAWNAHALAPAMAQDFYQGKTITIVVANTAGSGYDSYARILGRHMPKYIPGKPRVLVQNMPGAGSVKALEYTYMIAPKDGTHFTLAIPSALVEPLLGGARQYRYDPTKFSYVGTADSGTKTCATNGPSMVKTMEDARKRTAIIAATTVADFPNFLNALSGTKFRVVTGFPGPSDLLLAVERGEADGVCGLDLGTFRSLRPDWLKVPGKANFLFQAGLEPNEEMTRLGVPPIWNFIRDSDRDVVELIVSPQVFSRPFLAPPGTPVAQLKSLRSAFMAAMRDPELLEEARKASLDINAKSGEDVEALVNKIYSAPKNLIEKMSKAIRTP